MTENDHPIFVNERRVRCEGGGGVLGHPAIYLEIGNSGSAVCPYCSQKFVFNSSTHD